VNQSGGLKCLARPLPGEVLRDEPAQLVVDERQQVGSGRGSPAAASSNRVTSTCRRVYPVRPVREWEIDSRTADRTLGSLRVKGKVPDVIPEVGRGATD
jgi:hypothetical protein